MKFINSFKTNAQEVFHANGKPVKRITIDGKAYDRMITVPTNISLVAEFDRGYSQMACVTVGKYIYMFGGRRNNVSGPESSVRKFDTETH